MQNGIAHNGLILLWRMREGKHLCPGKTTLSDHAVLYLPVSTFVGTAHITEKDNAWLYSLSHQTSDFGESEWIHFTGSGYLLRTDAWSYPVLRLKRLGLSKTFRRLVITLTRRYGVSLIHLDASAECLPGLPTFNW